MADKRHRKLLASNVLFLSRALPMEPGLGFRCIPIWARAQLHWLMQNMWPVAYPIYQALCAKLCLL